MRLRDRRACGYVKDSEMRDAAYSCFLATMSPGKRSIEQVEDSALDGPPATRLRQDGENHRDSATPLRISYPTNAPRGPPPAFQYPNQLVSFSYSDSRELEFNNSAMRYYTQPPFNADLGYAYETWIKRPEERGRLDGLLTACLKDSEQMTYERKRANVVSWRGVMTK